MDPPRRPQTPANDLPPKPRTIPLQLLCVGLNRTGTQSLTKALEILGFPASEIYNHSSISDLNQEASWTGYLDTKFRGRFRGKNIGEEEFDDLMGDFSVITDLVPSMFTSELLATYATTPVILTTRSSASVWYTSNASTVFHSYIPEPSVHPSKLLADTCLKYKFGAKEKGWYKFEREDFEENAKKLYEEHNDMVKEKAEGRLLVFQPGDGWEPLCKFLGKDVPDVPYPREDSWVDYKTKNGTA